MTKKTHIPFADLQINVWSPTEPGQKWAAMFHKMPMIFFGDSNDDVRAKVNAWRDEQIALDDKKKANSKAAGERLKASREAKAS